MSVRWQYPQLVYIYLGGIEQEFSGDLHELLIGLIGHVDLRSVLAARRGAFAETDESANFDLGVLGFVQFLGREREGERLYLYDRPLDF